MNFRRWTAALEWSLLVAVVLIHLAAWLWSDWLASSLGTAGELFGVALPFVQASLLLLLVVFGPGWGWMRGLLLAGFVGWTALQFLSREAAPFAPDRDPMHRLLLFACAVTFVCAVALRLSGVRIVATPAGTAIDRSNGARFSIRGLLLLTTVVAGMAALAGWLRPYFVNPANTPESQELYLRTLTSMDLGEMAEFERLVWLGDLVRQAAMTLALVVAAIGAVWAILRPPTVWLRLAMLMMVVPMLGAYVAYLTASDVETAATFAAFVGLVAALVAGSLTPLRLMNYRLLRPARKVAGTLRVPVAARAVIETTDDGTQSVPATLETAR